jgi:hypothetical protein
MKNLLLPKRFQHFRWRNCVLLLAGSFILQATAMRAQVIGNITTNEQLKIEVSNNVNQYWYMIYKYQGNGWQNQFYMHQSGYQTELFALRIAKTVYTTNTKYATNATLLTKIDNDVLVNTGAEHKIAKTFTGNYQGSPFYVTWTISYNTTNTDYALLSAQIDLSRISSNPEVYYGYGFDSYVNGCDAGAAFLLPNIYNRNNLLSTILDLDASNIKKIRLLATKNTYKQNGNYRSNLLGFFAMGQAFDRIYSAYYEQARAFSVVGEKWSNKLSYKPYNDLDCIIGDSWDSGLAIAYKLQPGQVTTLQTGLTFTGDILAEMDYSWQKRTDTQGYKDLAANPGDTVQLNLGITPYSSIPNLSFEVDIPNLEIADACSQTGITGGNTSCNIGSSYFRLTSGQISKIMNASVTIPVRIPEKVCGQWIISAKNIFNTSSILPLGEPAILSVKSEVSFTPRKEVYIPQGESATITVQLPNGINPISPITVFLNYAGDTGSFTNRPASVVIPANTNRISFKVTANANTANGALMKIALKSTDSSKFITLGANTEISVKVGKKYILPINPNFFPPKQ